MRVFGQKIIIHSVIILIKIITFLKRSVFASFLILTEFIKKTIKLIIKIFILPIYKLYLPLKKKFKNFFEGSSKNKFFFIIAHQKSANVLIIILAILIAFSNIRAQEDQQGAIQISPLFVILGNDEEVTEEAILEENISLENYLVDAGAIKPLLQISKEADSDLEPENLICFFGDSFAFKPFSSITYQTPRLRTKTEIYVVQKGDTISDIAEQFNLSLNTILWENNLSARSLIKPGQELTILPINGITHKIKKGETLDFIAKKYQAKKEDVLEFNKLMNEKNLEVGLVLIIPNGKKYIAPIEKKSILQPTFQFVKGLFKGHIFPWGQCTWYVAQRRLIPWAGHAKDWIANARSYGYKVGNSPAMGSIVSLKETGWQARRWGHVAYVEKVEGNKIIISEMNYKGKGVYSKRTLPINDRRIIGYIY